MTTLSLNNSNDGYYHNLYLFNVNSNLYEEVRNLIAAGGGGGSGGSVDVVGDGDYCDDGDDDANDEWAYLSGCL